ncbi:DUF2590 family protein [Marinomonas sp. M1K-6]|uniref:DUF2590 family protein n=1 Tax=Marinomonas profundi TaxID=2726122 RepID=A0A847R1H7_9GAMM|nr:DUF2590 family protein [Marinomonas profundi]NLQ17552.1 DUF2590 family protein [Marinomonas profundi]UDV02231.1 DUF2590 family protein [Marinomonas profundi]
MPSIDLLIQDDDMVFSSIGEPLLVTGVDCVAQDIRHMIREKGYAWRMIGERNQTTINALCTEIEIEMENDERIYPGTANVTLSGETLICEAQTVAGERLVVTV